MNYQYYPGCSLKGTGKSYEESFLAVMKALGVGIEELDDWNCCGATAYMAVDEAKALALAARNLAIAEKKPGDVLAPCSACYLVLQKTKHYVEEYPEVGKRVHQALKSAGITYQGKAVVRHPLDVVINDIGLDTIKKHVKKPLTGLKVIPYYGCMIVRPYSTFDHPEYPVAMDKLFEALGATVLPYPLKTRCCGGSLTGTLDEVGQRLSYILLKEAKKRQADIMATLCPLCLFNLDSYQGPISARYDDVTMPVVYFTQLMGLAFGLSPKELGLHRHITSVDSALRALQPAAVG